MKTSANLFLPSTRTPSSNSAMPLRGCAFQHSGKQQTLMFFVNFTSAVQCGYRDRVYFLWSCCRLQSTCMSHDSRPSLQNRLHACEFNPRNSLLLQLVGKHPCCGAGAGCRRQVCRAVVCEPSVDAAVAMRPFVLSIPGRGNLCTSLRPNMPSRFCVGPFSCLLY